MPFGATVYRLISSFLHLCFCPYAIHVGRMPFDATIYRLLSSFLHLCFCPFFLRIYWKQPLLPAGCRGVWHTPHRMTPKGAKNLFLFLRFYPYAIRVGHMPFGAIVYRLLSSFLCLCFYPYAIRVGCMQYAPTA